MTDTQTAEHDTTLLDDAAQAAVEAGAKTLATIREDQQRFDEGQIAILRQLGIEDASQGDLDLFFHYARSTGLDPFRKQIYMIGRNTKLTEWVPRDANKPNGPKDKVEKWVTKYTIQIGIDGYRKHARQIADALGDRLAFDGPYWCGQDGQWRDVWTSDDPPVAAKYTVFRNGEPNTGIAKFSEYVQTNAVYEGSGQARQKVGDAPNSMWAKMPSNQIGKCAEALAYRRAFPDDFSGLILEGTDQPTVIHPDGSVDEPREPKQRPGGRGVGGLRDRARAAQQKHEVIDAEVEPDPTATSPEPGQGGGNEAGEGTEPSSGADRPASPPDQGAQESDLRKAARKTLTDNIFAIFGELKMNGDENRQDRLVVIGNLLSRTVESTKDLTVDDLQQLRNALVSRKQAGTLDADVTDIINGDELRRAGIDPDSDAK